MPHSPQYALLDLIHEGSRTLLYRGVRNSDRLPVVVKCPKSPSPTGRELAQLRHEYAVLREIALPGVVRAYGLEKCDHGLALVLEQVSGQPLSEILAARRLDLKTVLYLAVTLAGILEGVHRCQVIHKDITPYNILFHEPTRQVHLMDFGIAARLSHETQKATVPEALEGTLAYLSPEQTGRMNRMIDRRTDFYSLGVTLYEMLTGVLPFTATHPMELVHCHIARAPVPPHVQAPDVPEMVSQIVMKLLAKTAEDRYQSAGGLKADLMECVQRIDASGDVRPFPLGRRDQLETLHIPQKLYGRAEEERALLRAFERAAAGAAGLVLVSGYSGIGKSALVHEIHKAIAHRGGYFIAGKFDQLNRSVPYAPLAQAFRELIRQFLGEQEQELGGWRAKFQAALGNHGQILVELIPELELLIGPQPPAAVLGPTESQNRFNEVFKSFTRVLTGQKDPLVLFLDDLQWIDPASLKLLQVLLTDPESGHRLIIGAYRDNEVDASHPLRLALDDLRKTGAAIDEITLGPLTLSDVVDLLADTLGADRSAVGPFAQVVFDRTQSNPFFVKQFLGMLYAEKLVWFHADSAAWMWDIKKIRECPVTENVVEFMAGKIQKLAPGIQQVLKLAACIGHQFDLRMLSVIHRSSPAETAARLWQALEEGLILPVGIDYRLVHSAARDGVGISFPELEVRYRFLHDRVQQAAYSLIEPSDRKEAHLSIGRLMLSRSADSAHDEALFDMASHLNEGAVLITDSAEKTKVAELNLFAGKKAKTATAYEAAAGYLRAGTELLSGDAWESHYELAFALHKERAEAEYLSGRFDEAERLYPVALAHARTALDKVSLHFVQVTQYQLQGRYAEAIEIQRAGLGLLGWDIPVDMEPLRALLDEELKAIGTSLGARRIEDLTGAPKMARPEHKAMMEFCQGMLYSAYLHGNQTLANLSLVKMTTLSLQNGNSEFSPFGYIGYGLVAGGLLADYKTGHRFGKMGIELCDQFDNVAIQCKANFLFAADVNNWNQHIKSSDVYYDRAYELGLESGDWVTVGYMIIQSGSDRLTRGKPLAELFKICQAHLTFLKRARNDDAIDLLRAGVIQPILNLQGLTNHSLTFDNEDFEEAAYLAKYAGSGYYMAWLYYAKIRSAFLFRDIARWPALIDKLSIVETSVPSHSKVPETFFYVALMRLGLCGSAGDTERSEHLEAVTKLQVRMKIWLENCPENILHKWLLVEAEKARIDGRIVDAMRAYDEAILSAEESEYINNQALGNELYARFWLEQGKMDIAYLYLRKAAHLYERWGAAAKARHVEQTNPEAFSAAAPWQESHPAGADSAGAISGRLRMEGSLDLAMLLQAGQTISREIVLGKVIDRLMRIVLSNAGATRGFLLLERDGTLVAEASIAVDPELVQVGMRTAVAQIRDLAASVVEAVARTREAIVLSDATRDPRFAADPYIAIQKPKSILCLALTHQARLTGVLYLENNLARDAFSASRIELLELLSSQAASAVENALLYSDLQEVGHKLQESNERLEQQVAGRTEELREANETLQRRTEELRLANERLTYELRERERAEASRALLQEEVIRIQRAQLLEVSAPLIPITDDIMVMPLIGTVDELRSQQVLDTLLQGAQRGARVLVLDVTGMKHVDSQAAGALVKAANAVRLLGAEAMLTGVRSEVAQTLVQLGVDMGNLVIRSTLQSGVAYALGLAESAARRQRTITRKLGN